MVSPNAGPTYTYMVVSSMFGKITCKLPCSIVRLSFFPFHKGKEVVTAGIKFYYLKVLTIGKRDGNDSAMSCRNGSLNLG